MTLKRIEKEAAKRGIPKHHVHHWWNRLTDREKDVLNTLEAGGITSLIILAAGHGITDVLALPPLITGGYIGYNELRNAINKWHDKKEKKFRSEWYREVNAESRKRMKEVI